MATNIIKPAYLIVFVPDDNQTFGPEARHAGIGWRRNLRYKIIAGSFDLTLMSDQHPLLREYSALLFNENFVRNEVSLCQSFGPSREGFNRLAERRHCFRLHEVTNGPTLRAQPPASIAEDFFIRYTGGAAG